MEKKTMVEDEESKMFPGCSGIKFFCAPKLDEMNSYSVVFLRFLLLYRHTSVYVTHHSAGPTLKAEHLGSSGRKFCALYADDLRGDF
jgi:hypothetical protein